jgi:uncharacterized protein YbjT (DUF2867 family)
MLEPESLGPALDGIETAYYMVHSMASADGFEERDREAASHFARAASEAGVRRIVYLGGLGDEGSGLSAHLRSRHEVGRILRSTGVPVIEFRASIVIGTGSLSFEMVRALVERLPVMIAPRWVSVEAQPIAIGELLRYLVAARETPLTESRVFEIGGADRVSYHGIMREYARQRGLRRWIIPVPVLSPRLSSLWLGLVTPVFVRVGRKLIESIRHPTVVRDASAAAWFGIEPAALEAAICDALREDDEDEGAGGAARLIDSRTLESPQTPAEVFTAIERIGGRTGWYHADWLWRLRGWMDRCVGGPGLRRGRTDPERLVPGDRVDFWRVETIEHGRRLCLRAEMKLPGRAWLEWEVRPAASGSVIRQTAIFDARGLLGRMYWYAVLPLHHYVFEGMLRAIARAAGKA